MANTVAVPLQFQLSSVSSSHSIFAPLSFRFSNSNYGPNVRSQCRVIKVSALQEANISRRNVTFGSCVMGTAMIWSMSPSLETAKSADLIERQQRSELLSKIRASLKTSLQANPDLILFIMRMALNDAITYNKSSKTGGANGSIRFSSEIRRPENEELVPALNFIENVKKEIDTFSKGGPVSYSDLIQFAGQGATKITFLNAAVRKCGGNEEKGQTLYNAFGSNGQWGLFDKQFGRSDADTPDPEGRVIKWEEAPIAEIKSRFAEVGLGPRQLVVMSAFLGTNQEAMEAKLVSDPELAPWVEKYQRSRETISQTDYEVDLINTFTKLSCLGQKINYEAYTYPRTKIDISKLKL